MYRTDVYYLAKNLAELPLTLFLPLLFISICYYMIGLYSPAENFFICAGILILVANAAVSFGELSVGLVMKKKEWVVVMSMFWFSFSLSFSLCHFLALVLLILLSAAIFPSPTLLNI